MWFAKDDVIHPTWQHFVTEKMSPATCEREKEPYGATWKQLGSPFQIASSWIPDAAFGLIDSLPSARIQPLGVLAYFLDRV